MRRVSMLSVLVVLAAALLLPSATMAAAPFKFRILRDHCEHNAQGHPKYVVFKVRAKELGVSGANYFRIASRAQTSDGSGWETVIDWGWEYSTTFPNDATNYYHDLRRRYDFVGDDDYIRIRMRVQAWSNSQGLLVEKVMVSEPCFAVLP